MKISKMSAFKVMTTAAISSLIFSSYTSLAYGKESTPLSKHLAVQKPQLLTTAQKGKENLYNNAKNAAKDYKPTDKVRFIVEVAEPSSSTVSQTQKRALFKEKQDKVLDVIQKNNKAKSISPKLKQRFYEGFNGFSVETEYQNLNEIKKAPGVIGVHIARTYHETMAASKELVQAQKVWNQNGYQGEGLLVAVVDSGIDYTHKDMTITEKGKQKEKLTKSGIQSKLDATAVGDVWYTDKVPTGYDWADHDTDVIPRGDGSPHGTHVSGIIGANGDESKDGVQGIAPGTQLLAEKVFSDNDTGAYEDDIIAGIEHAVTMGADVINMSLGVDAGTVSEDDDPIQKAIRVATEQGTLVVVAAGNSAYSSEFPLPYPSAQQPYAEDPDIGTVGAPGVSPFALSVASYENTQMHLNTLADANGFKLPFQDQTMFAPSVNFKLSKNLTLDQEYEMVYAGEGSKPTDFTNKNVEGKIVVVKMNNQYTSYSFAQFNAAKYKAKAVIVVPPDVLNDYPYLGFSQYSIPAATTGKAVGQELINKLTSGQIVKMKLAGGTWIDNVNKNKMSSFSSYGTPSTLDFKPEISAPGGNIYSTVPGNDYEVMSGTSMATPHVVGGSALVLQSLYEKGLQHSEDTALKAKIALMNTSKVVMDPRTNSEVPYSPRVQGSGLMQIQNAINTPVIVTRKDTPLEQASAVALKEIKNDRATFKLNVQSLEAKNPKQEYEYTVNVDLLTDATETKQFDLDGDGTLDSKDYLTLSSKQIEGASIYVNDEKISSTDGTTFKIKPGQEKNLNVEIRLPRTLRKNAFVEGFVRLVPKDSMKAVPLSIPYMGFNGSWDEPRNIDAPAWDKDAFLGYTALWDEYSGSAPKGFDAKTGTFNLNKIAISPNYYLHGIYAGFTALRNLQKTEMFIENSKGKMVNYLGDFSEYTGTPWKFRKNIMSYGDYGYSDSYYWNMTDQSGNLVPDGTYQYVIRTTLDYPGAKPQEVKMPVKVDSVLPSVTDIKVTPTNGKYEISWKGTDNVNGSGYVASSVWVNGTNYTPGSAQTLLVNSEPKSIVVVGADNAFNHSYTVWGDPSPKYMSEWMVLSNGSVYPSTNINKDRLAGINYFAQNRSDWTFNVKDATGNIVDTISFKNEKEIHTKWVPKSDLPNGTYYISADVVSKDGFKVSSTPIKVTVLQ
ncbi:S8 family serine peptidase [Bacillus sp. AFS017336]|uniref:S8 family serine peptidase n=1 Tax=Bacillus sp. AFS017336 TaxID=2033489 RepID=UPI000BF1AC1F|nr:S8 family serine peptidase [Bacillus sp. AFS017336]PEL12457.1 hypothetical protein CN601_07420 [Bacillus sp. AFS017336]